MLHWILSNNYILSLKELAWNTFQIQGLNGSLREFSAFLLPQKNHAKNGRALIYHYSMNFLRLSSSESLRIMIAMFSSLKSFFVYSSLDDYAINITGKYCDNFNIIKTPPPP